MFPRRVKVQGGCRAGGVLQPENSGCLCLIARTLPCSCPSWPWRAAFATAITSAFRPRGGGRKRGETWYLPSRYRLNVLQLTSCSRLLLPASSSAKKLVNALCSGQRAFHQGVRIYFTERRLAKGPGIALRCHIELLCSGGSSRTCD